MAAAASGAAFWKALLPMTVVLLGGVWPALRPMLIIFTGVHSGCGLLVDEGAPQLREKTRIRRFATAIRPRHARGPDGIFSERTTNMDGDTTNDGPHRWRLPNRRNSIH